MAKKAIHKSEANGDFGETGNNGFQESSRRECSLKTTGPLLKCIFAGVRKQVQGDGTNSSQYKTPARSLKIRPVVPDRNHPERILAFPLKRTHFAASHRNVCNRMNVVMEPAD